MDRIRHAFSRLRRSGRKALIPFVMGGDPSLAVTESLIIALAASGADLIEIGIPFSDPLADGPIIQRASGRALAHGTTPGAVLACVARVSARVTVPLVLLSYWNPIARYGNGSLEPGPFVRAAQRAGVSGIVIPDLPPEEAASFRRAAHRCAVAPVFLAAPTSPAARLRRIVRASEGFIYYVSVTGTTGVRKRLPAELAHHLRQVRLMTTKPICVGFGISTPAQAAAAARLADGVIIGSALLRALEPHLAHPARLVRQAQAFVQRFRRVV